MAPVAATAQRPQRASKDGVLRALLGSKLVSALVYPKTVDHYLELVSPRLAVHQIRAQVVDVLRETADVVTLVLAPSGNFPGFVAGQYTAISVEIDGVRHTRVFSLSSAPERGDGYVTMTIKARAKGGLVSPWLLKNAKVGLWVTLAAPEGQFVLPESLPERLLFISGGSGITPCMSMLRSLVARGYRGEVLFVHFARTRADVIFGRELAELALRLPNLRVVVQTEEELGGLPNVSEAGLAALVPDFERWDAWVCGPAPLMDAARSGFAARGAAGKLRTEAFVLATPSAADGEGGQLSLARSGKRVDGDGRTLLQQVEEAGVHGKRGCGMGICMSCRCTKLSGVTRNVRTGHLSTDDHEDIQLCISVPVGDVTLDI
jgi:stearoyl-CoA 9-desaturase NADPH oxidoreductase